MTASLIVRMPTVYVAAISPLVSDDSGRGYSPILQEIHQRDLDCGAHGLRELWLGQNSSVVYIQEGICDISL